jgi:hypothetical protein
MSARDHEITPRRGTARTRDGEPADLRSDTGYPLTAECLACGRPIRCDRPGIVRAWYHTQDTEQEKQP